LKNYLLRKDKAYLGGKWLFNIFQHLKNN
jgi:hypothetical protein